MGAGGHLDADPVCVARNDIAHLALARHLLLLAMRATQLTTSGVDCPPTHTHTHTPLGLRCSRGRGEESYLEAHVGIELQGVLVTPSKQGVERPAILRRHLRRRSSRPPARCRRTRSFSEGLEFVCAQAARQGRMLPLPSWKLWEPSPLR